MGYDDNMRPCSLLVFAAAWTWLCLVEALDDDKVAKICLLGMTGTNPASGTGNIGRAAMSEMVSLLMNSDKSARIEISVLSRRGGETVDPFYADVASTQVQVKAVQGSIFEPLDVAKTCTDAKLALFVAPTGNDISGESEVESIRRILQGLRSANVPKLLMTCGQAWSSTGNAGPMKFDYQLQDVMVKQVAEEASPFQDYAIVQTASWMETFFENSFDGIKAMGIFIGCAMPKPICFTKKSDIGIVTGKVAALLLQANDTIPHHEYDLYDPIPYTDREILAMASEITGKELWGIGKTMYAFVAKLRPVFEFFGSGNGTHLAKIFAYLLEYGYVPDGPSASENQKAVLELGFTPTSLRTYFEEELSAKGDTAEEL